VYNGFKPARHLLPVVHNNDSFLFVFLQNESTTPPFQEAFMQRILITGANRGVGLELVRQCLARGGRVFAGCRHPQQSEALLKLSEIAKPNLTLVKLDVVAERSLDEARRLIGASVEALDLLFNNAAISLGDEQITGVTAEKLAETLRVNAIGPVLVAQRFFDLLKMGSSPRLVNISSEAGSIGRMRHFRGYGYYGSKAALNMYTRSLSLDPNLSGITVIALHPGWVRTDMGGPMAALSAEESAKKILAVVDRLTPQDTGKFYTYTGDEYPW
jgi:NAD(P)-dependent dehydrogenase (short-subunit alcohol dehydrogenase family)